MNTGGARAAFDAARAAYSRAILEVIRRPGDPEARALLRAALRDVRAAHREAVTAGIAAQIGDGPGGE
jgi:hypothetical protein